MNLLMLLYKFSDIVLIVFIKLKSDILTYVIRIVGFDIKIYME